MSARKRTLTKFDKEKRREDVKTLYFLGYSLADAARTLGVEINTAKSWSAEDGWTAEIQRIRNLMKDRQPPATAAQMVAFDIASTHKENRALLTKGIHKAATHIAEKMEGEDILKAAIGVKAIVGSAKELDGTWQDSSASKFAVALNLNQIVSSGAIKPVPPGYTVVAAEP